MPKYLFPKKPFHYRKKLITFTLIHLTLWLSFLAIIAYVRISDTRRDFAESAKEEIFEMTHRMDNYNDVLFATRSIILQNPDLKVTGWNQFLYSMDLVERYPDIVGISYSKVVSAENTLGYEKRLDFLYDKYDDSYSIKSPVIFPKNYIFTFAYHPSSDDFSSIGYNFANETNRKSAIEKAIRTGISQATPVTQLIDDLTKDTTILIYFPIYDTTKPISTEIQRQEAASGVLSLVFTVPGLLQNSFFLNDAPSIGYKITDITESDSPSFVYERHAEESAINFEYKSTIDFSGRLWEFNFELPLTYLLFQPRTLIAIGLLIFMVSISSIMGNLLLYNFLKNKSLITRKK